MRSEYHSTFGKPDPNVSFLEAVLLGDKKQALHWLNRGASIDGPPVTRHNPNPAIPLIEAARNKRPNMIDWLLDCGADIKKTDHYGDSALHKAASAGDPNSVAILIDRGAEVNALNGNRSTPLHRAALGNHAAVTRLLIINDANPHARDRAGQTPFHLTQDANVRRTLQKPVNNTLSACLLTLEDRAPEPSTTNNTMMQSLRYMIQNWRDQNPGIDTPKPEF